MLRAAINATPVPEVRLHVVPDEPSRPPPAAILRGREAELAVIAQRLAATARGGGGVLLVEGPPGIGKSSLLREARAMAARAGVRPLVGEAFESRRAVPFGPLLAATLDGDPPIGRPELARTLDGPPDLRYWMLHELQGALESAALDTPLVLVLDDLQWADTPTLVALSTLPGRLSGAPILWILALRGRQARPEVRDATARLERDGAQWLRVEALSADAVAAVVADALGAEADRALLELAANARGNPFLLVELLEGLREEGRVATDRGRAVVAGQGLPRRVTESMRDRIERLSEPAQRAVRVASVLGHRFSAEHLAAMLDGRPSSLVAALDEAMRADLIVESGDRLDFRHDLIRQAVLETMPRSVRRALCREVAAVLLESGAAPVEVAVQLADNAEAGDRDAIAQLRAAARTLAGSDAAAAADLSVRALELLSPFDPDRGPLVAETVVLLHSAMRTDDARALGDSALADALEPAQEAELRLSMSGTFMRSTMARADENRRALALPGLTPVMRARHLGWLTYNLAVTGRTAEAWSVAPSATAAAHETGDLQARAMTTLGVVCAECATGRFARALTRIEELRRLTRSVPREPYLLVAAFHHANVLAELGRLDEALGVLAEGVARGRRERNAWLLETWPHYGSLLRLSAGRLADARAEAEACARTVDEVAAGYSAGVRSMLTLAQVAIHTGDAKQLKASVEDARAVYERADAGVRRGVAWILALADMDRGRPAEAARWLYDDDMPYAAPFLPGFGGHQPTVARIALAADDRELALRALEVAENVDRESPGVPLIAASAAHTRGLVDADSATLVDAARLFRATQHPLLLAAACEDAGRSLAGEGRTQDAVALLTEALETYAGCEATADARRVGRLLREHGVRRRVPSHERPATGWPSLTASELRVARLVATGATNRDAAERLFLSPHTVSSHLRSAFAKLGINSRVELARVALEHDDDAPRSRQS